MTVSTSKVTKWADQSPNANDFTPPGVGPTVASAAIGGKDALNFSGTTLTKTALVGWAPGSQDFVVEVVAKPVICSNVTACNMWFGLDTNGNVLLSAVSTATLAATGQIAGGGGMSADFPQGSVHVFGARRTGATGEVRLDGVPTNGGTVNDPFTTATDATIGPFMDGEIAEVVVAKGVSAADVAKIEAYLKAKYGL